MSDSETDQEGLQPQAKRQKRFKFKTFAQRVADVDVDVYRSLGAKRSEPLPGATSFFQEHLNKWRELNSAADFNETAQQLQPLVLSLPLLVHHKEEILQLLLNRLHMSAALSLEPLLDLLGTLSRDLQADFLPFLPRVLAALADLVDDGAEREPELLEHVFAALSLMCKHLVKLLAPDPAPALRAAARLRHHAAPHVRALAARSLGFLLRHAPPAALRGALRLVLGEAARSPTVECVEGAGALIAEAAMGVGNGLHSRAGAVLGFALGEDLLRPRDFKVRSGGEGKLLARDVRAAVAAAGAAALDRLLDHVRRGKCGELWEVAVAEANKRLDYLSAAQSATTQQVPEAKEKGAQKAGAKRGRGAAAAAAAEGEGEGEGEGDEQDGKSEGDSDAVELRASSARALALVCRMVEYFRGARVESYAPLFKLAARVAGPEVWEDARNSHTDSSRLGPSGTGDDVAGLKLPSLTWQALRLMLALVHSHAKVVGASAGPAAIEKAALQWAGVFSKATPRELLPFLRGLISHPGGLEVAKFFGPQLLGALGRCLMDGVASDTCWPLLMDACATLRPAASSLASTSVVPVILTASGCGRQLSMFVRGAARLESATGGAADVAVAWAALQCLPHACESPEQALSCCEALIESTQSVISAQQAQHAEQDALLALHCEALAEHAVLLAQHGPSKIESLVFPALGLVRERPGDYHAVHAAAVMLEQAQNVGQELPTHTLQELLPALAPNLSAPSGALRRETLRVLCAFRQPALLAPPGTDGAPPPEQECEALVQLLAIESRQMGMDSGRPAVVALGRLKNHLEYRRLPEWLVPAVVHELLGVLHIRFSLLWPAAAEALATALDTYPSLAWHLIHRQISAAQSAFLAGDIGLHRSSGAGGVDRTLAAAGDAAAPFRSSSLWAEEGGGASPSLAGRFAAAVEAGAEAATGGATDAAVRLNQLLRALAKAGHAGVEAKAKDWVPLLLEYCNAKTVDGVVAGGGEEEEEPEEEGEPKGETELGEEGQLAGISSGPPSAPAAVSARAWRGSLREWLTLLSGLRGIRGMWGAQQVQRAVAAQLLSPDPGVQLAALRCLKVFRFKWLAPYVESLARLCDNKTLRAELTSFPLAPSASCARDGDDVAALAQEHRPALVPLLIRLLYPKMRKRSGRLGGKGAPGSARSAILNFLSACPPSELRPLLELFLGPLATAFVRRGAGNADVEDDITVAQGEDSDCLRLTEVPWWGHHLGKEGGSYWLERIDVAVLNAQPLRRRVGYLNMLEDLLTHLGHSIKPYLPELCALVLCLLEGATQQVQLQGEAAEGEDQDEVQGRREIRTHALRLLAAVLERFPDGCDYSFLWRRLLTTVAPFLPRIPMEASSDRVPALMQLAASLAASHLLVPLLADSHTLPPAGLEAADGSSRAPVEGEKEEEGEILRPYLEPWAAKEHLGSRLLGDCIAALSAGSCSEAARGVMLGALESIFDLPDPLGPLILAPHLRQLLEGLQAIVGAVWRQQGGRARRPRAGRGAAAAGPRRDTAKRALAILEVVGARVGGWEEARQLTGALIPLLQPKEGGRKKGRHDEELVMRTLAVLAALWDRLGSDTNAAQQAEQQAAELSRVAGVLAPLMGSLEGREARSTLCRALAALGTLLPEVAPAAAELMQLNAMSTTQVDEPDYEARMAAYSRLQPPRWRALGASALPPLVHQCCHDLRNADDLAIRHAASQALSRLIESAGASGDVAAAPEGTAESTDTPAAAAAQRVLFPQLKKGLAASNLAVRQEHLSLLRQLALAFPAHYADLAELADPDAELDFFLNVAHIQLHRRARALTRFAKLLRSSNEGDKEGGAPALSLGSLVGVVTPLLQLMVAEGRDSEDSGHEVRQADRDRGANVADAAVGALGAVAGALPWVQYQQLLGQFLRLMKKYADTPSSKPVIRAVCAILDAFHFLEPGAEEEREGAELIAAVRPAAMPAPEGGADVAVQQEGDAGAEPAVEEGGNDMAADDVEADVAGRDDELATVPREEVYRLLLKRVIPEMRRQLIADKDRVRAPVALALVKVLRLLPPRAMRLELPRVLQGVANLLKGRMQSTRDSSRTVLVSMSRELGPDYLPFVCDVLRSALPLRGYTAHVLGYTLHAVLEGVLKDAPTGAIDDSLPLILPMMEAHNVQADLFGEVAEAKEVAAFAGIYKEAKRCRAYDTFQLLAASVTFHSHIAELLSSVQSRLAEASHPKTRSKLSTMLLHASRGVLANPSATPRDLAMFVFATADAGLAAEEAVRERAEAAAGAATSSGIAAPRSEEDKAALHQHLLVEFALSLMHGALKKGLVNPKSPDAAPLLDPLLPLLVRALKSRHAPSVSAALRTLSILIYSPLPGLAKAAAGTGKAVTELLKRCPKTSHPIAQDCFKLLGGMLRQCQGWQPGSMQLRFLMGWAFTDLEETVNNQNAFHLLKAILSRQLVVPEVYDLMGRVQELMVRSQGAAVRSACSAALLQFLLDYPLGSKRLRQHLDFLLSNLAYEHESGREAALEFITLLIHKFPQQLVDEWSETIFLPLVIRLVNDPSSKCRTMVGAALRALLTRLPAPRQDRLVLYCTAWLGGEDARLKRAAAQVLGILAEVEGTGFGRRAGALLPTLGAILAHVATLDAELTQQDRYVDDGDESAGAGAPGWQEAYYTLVLLEKVLGFAAEQLSWSASSAAVSCWRGARQLLLHRHLWVRKAAGRLMGAGLASAEVAVPMMAEGGQFAAGALALSFFRQLESESADEALAGQAVKCLVFLSTLMYEDDFMAGRVPPTLQLPAATAAASEGVANGGGSKKGEDEPAIVVDFAATDEQESSEEEEREEREGAGEEEEEVERGEEGDGEEREEERASGALTLSGLVRRMVRLADDKSYVRQLQRGTALRFVAAVAARLGTDRVLPYLPALMRPLYRITEPGAAGNPEDIKTLAEEVVSYLRGLVGSDALLAAYQLARGTVRRQRGERKKAAAVQALVDPEAAARRKQRAQQRKSVGRKRQMEQVKRLRSAGVAVKNKRAQGEERGEAKRWKR